MGLREITDGNRDTQLSEQNYAKRTATRLREAKIMKICPKNRKNGLYEPKNAIFGLFFTISSPLRIKNSQEKKNIRSNNRLQATTHKLPLCTRLGTLHTYSVQPVGRRLNRDVRRIMKISILPLCVILLGSSCAHCPTSYSRNTSSTEVLRALVEHPVYQEYQLYFQLQNVSSHSGDAILIEMDGSDDLLNAPVLKVAPSAWGNMEITKTVPGLVVDYQILMGEETLSVQAKPGVTVTAMIEPLNDDHVILKGVFSLLEITDPRTLEHRSRVIPFTVKCKIGEEVILQQMNYSLELSH